MTEAIILDIQTFYIHPKKLGMIKCYLVQDLSSGEKFWSNCPYGINAKIGSVLKFGPRNDSYYSVIINNKIVSTRRILGIIKK